MQRLGSCLVLTALVLASAAPGAQAQDPRVQQLERNLQERDRVINELLERVRVLERRVGVGRPAQERARTPKPEAAPKAPSEDPAPAPGVVAVDEDAAERALDRSLTVAGALLLPRGVLEVEPSVTYSRQEDSAPQFVASGGQLFLGETERDSNALTADLALRLGLPWDSQLEVGIPYRWRSTETVTNIGFSPAGASERSGTGLGDLRVGVAKTLLREGLWRPDLVGRITWDTDTGAKSDNGVSLGGGYNELRGALTSIKRQDPIAFVGGLSYTHAFESEGVRPGSTIAADFGGYIALSPETSLRLALSGAYQTETELAGRAVDGSDRAIGTLIVGGSTLLTRGTLLNLSTGIGLTDDADDLSVSLSLPVRFGTPLY